MDERTVQNRTTIFLTDALRALNGVRIVPLGGIRPTNRDAQFCRAGMLGYHLCRRHAL